MADFQTEQLMQFASVRIVTQCWDNSTDEQKLRLVQHLLARAELTGLRLNLPNEKSRRGV